MYVLVKISHESLKTVEVMNAATAGTMADEGIFCKCIVVLTEVSRTLLK